MGNAIQQFELMPAQWRDSRRRRRSVRGWVAASTSLAAILVVAIAIVRVTFGERIEPVRERAVAAEQIKRGLTVELATLRPRVTGAEQTLAVSRELSARPPWSALLALVGRQIDANLTLRSIQLRQAVATATPVPDAASRNPAAVPAFSLTIQGVAVDQARVARFVLDLERLDVFRQTRMLATRPESIGTIDGIGFQLQGDLGEGAEDSR